MRRLALSIGFAALCLAGCGGEECLVFDYAPPSLRFTLSDASTNEVLCGLSVSTDDERLVVTHTEACSYELPEWADPDLGRTATLLVTGYEDQTVDLPAPELDECDEILAPNPVGFELVPTL